MGFVIVFMDNYALRASSYVCLGKKGEDGGNAGAVCSGGAGAQQQGGASGLCEAGADESSVAGRI